MKIRPFPTASGFLDVDGGREGRVIFIENLNNSGAGSAREAFLTTEPRIIISRVSGYVDLSSNISIVPSISTPYIYSDFTYLGGLSAGDGLIFRDAEIRVAYTKNVIIRGIVVRTGDRLGVLAKDFDSLSFSNTSSFPNENLIVDRSSLSWGIDETGSFAGKNVTVQYCIIAEGLNDSFHEKGPHGYGGIFSGENMSIHHNLISRFTQRYFLFANERNYPNAVYDYRNNALYGWSADTAKLQPENFRINIVKNSYKPTNAAANDIIKSTIALFNDTVVETLQKKVYPFGNIVHGFPLILEDVESQKQGIRGRNGTLTALKDQVVNDTEFPYPWTHNFNETVAESDQKIKDYAGSIKRDSVDQRIINEWWNGTSPVSGSKTGLLGIIDSQDDVGGYPVLDTTSDPILTGPAPHYLPEWFTTKYGLSTVFDYTLAGTKLSSPERFIIFKGGQGVQLSQYVGSVNLETDFIYNVYEVLYMHYVPISSTEFEIDLLENGIPEPTTYNLTLSSSNPTLGTVSRNVNNPVTAGATVQLTATPVGTGVFNGWYLGSVSFANLITTDNPYSRVVNSDATIIGHFIDGTPIPPEQPRKKWAKKRPIV